QDVEFYWDSVQQAFRDILVDKMGPIEDRPAYERAIQFHPWFYYQEGLCYIEHGHQYDEYCSFDYVLNPVEPEGLDGSKKPSILLSIASAGARYVCNLVPSLDPH